jgi:uncharacterized protein YecE (DUF72 family)
VKEILSDEERATKRLARPRAEPLDLAFQMFESALGPLRRARKLGLLVFQFPRWFTATRGNAAYIERCRDRLADDRLAIEFRHASWLADERRERTFDLLRSLGLTYVIVDEPQLAAAVPPVCETTSDEGYVRFHGQNAENWTKRGISAAERYKYLYSERELSDWATRLRKLDARHVNVVFNNCYSNFGVMNATTMKQILGRGR